MRQARQVRLTPSVCFEVKLPKRLGCVAQSEPFVTICQLLHELHEARIFTVNICTIRQGFQGSPRSRRQGGWDGKVLSDSEIILWDGSDCAGAV